MVRADGAGELALARTAEAAVPTWVLPICHVEQSEGGRPHMAVIMLTGAEQMPPLTRTGAGAPASRILRD